jgi:phosphatidate cytidylyltransferase
VVWHLSVLVWVPGGLWMLRFGLHSWGRVAQVWRLLAGWLAIALAWWALVAAKAVGLNFLMSILTLVWAADVAAYFGGRAWGLRKLAPHISPGKTWAGAWSGVAAVCALGLLWLWADTRGDWGSSSLYTVLWQRSPVLLPVGVALLVGLSIAGDLLESLVKRVAGVKDSSGLLPGHGGVLDRVDALLPVLPVAVWLSVL